MCQRNPLPLGPRLLAVEGLVVTVDRGGFSPRIADGLGDFGVGLIRGGAQRALVALVLAAGFAGCAFFLRD